MCYKSKSCLPFGTPGPCFGRIQVAYFLLFICRHYFVFMFFAICGCFPCLPNFGDLIHRIYPTELEIKDTTDTVKSASYLDFPLSQLIRYARACRNQRVIKSSSSAWKILNQFNICNSKHFLVCLCLHMRMAMLWMLLSMILIKYPQQVSTDL